MINRLAVSKCLVPFDRKRRQDWKAALSPSRVFHGSRSRQPHINPKHGQVISGSNAT
jgi:hypothetical protein